MKLILIQNVNKLGVAGSTVDVKKGYAVNFLLPNNLAIIANARNQEKIDSMKQDLVKKNEDLKQKSLQNVEKLQGKPSPHYLIHHS
ncbi:MAG TPA: 50S ribosomal protein L9, partial [Candidatus Megaira endosymbiont of Hartmannula sinica]|nr:50S ribosomal protein L9 [Candidatus Megaera endosymbiont of Hartmannula sinica]